MVVDDDDLILLLQILLEQKGSKVNGFTDPLLALELQSWYIRFGDFGYQTA